VWEPSWTCHALLHTCFAPPYLAAPHNSIFPPAFPPGNDFLPNLPSLDIYDRPSALETLLNKYKVG